MAMKFDIVPESAFKEFQIEAGMILKKLDPTGKTEPQEDDVVCVTSGGVTVGCSYTYGNYADDVDNLPADLKEFMYVDTVDCTLETTALNVTQDVIRLALGAADINTSDGSITPRMELADTDFSDIWWVGKKLGGGWAAARLKDALSSGGFTLKTTKKGKGNIDIKLTGHRSIKTVDEVPMVLYSVEVTA